MTRTIDSDGTIQVGPLGLGFSKLASAEARDQCIRQFTQAAAAADRNGDSDLSVDALAANPEAARRRADTDIILPLLAKQNALWGDAVEIEPREIGGVYTEVFRPRAGVSPSNANRVLINLHGGGFTVGGRTHGKLESIPIAAQGLIEIVSVDYRMAPEWTFPAASEDVATVYRDLLTRYEPGKIGIYGSSAGGMLTAQAIPWFLQEGLPLPGAVGMLGCTGQAPTIGDSSWLTHHLYAPAPGLTPDSGLSELLYFKGADVESPLVAPMHSPETLAQFPPSLLITSTRALEQSSVLDGHNKLTLAGATSQLHVWDGLGHCFYLDADLPETHEAERIIIDFFARHLA